MVLSVRVFFKLLRLRAPRFVIAAALKASLFLVAPASLQAQLPAVADTAAVAKPVRLAGTRTYQIPFKQLGASFPLQLKGVEGNSGVPFSVRGDEIVVAAKVRISYSYSPAMLSDISHIRVLINEETAALIPVPRDQGGTNLIREVVLPPHLVTDFNRLNFELIGHYTTECEDPSHSSLWAVISNQSVLELTVAQVALANDLALLPQPFFDRRDVRSLSLPFVMSSAPDNATLEAAAMVASWFGGLSGYRGAKFPVVADKTPARGNAVVLAVLAQGVTSIAGVEVAALQGPTLSVVAHATDPQSKLLLIMGRDAAELKTAATALTAGAPSLSGQTATVSSFKQLLPRNPYDAPAWLNTHRPVKFGELSAKEQLSVSGYSPDLIRINFRLPPDLFGWREKGIPVDLKYRYTPRPTPDKSSLNISINGQFLRSLPLLATDHTPPRGLERLLPALGAGALDLQRERLLIPMFMQPSQTQMQFHYYYDYVKQGACMNVLLDNVRGAIDPDSTVDISGLSHFLAMPDLAAFGNSGFPFTRMADLSETAVVLPDSASSRDIAAFLGLMGRMGSATGYPTTAVTVVRAQQVDSVARKDLLVIASGSAQPLMTLWASAMPLGLDDGGSRRFNLSDWAYRLVAWWDTDQHTNAQPRSNQVTFRSNSSDAVIAGFESPLANGRSVIMLASHSADGLDQAVNALLDADLVKKVQGSAAVVRGIQVDSLLSEPTYFVGYLNPLLHARWYLSQRPLGLIALGVLSALLLATVLYVSLRARARHRLKVQPSTR